MVQLLSGSGSDQKFEDVWKCLRALESADGTHELSKSYLKVTVIYDQGNQSILQTVSIVTRVLHSVLIKGSHGYIGRER